MSLKTKLLVMMTVTLVSIIALNHFVFSMGNECYCVTEQMVEDTCMAFCENDGGCDGWIADPYGVCWDGDCYKDANFMCSERNYFHVTVNSWGCIDCGLGET